ncbi:MAG: extracellular solute-binding protein [Chloroflexi bacterium]|nr:extracellular solute-binding protein [Chloroflexota bacterium]
MKPIFQAACLAGIILLAACGPLPGAGDSLTATPAAAPTSAPLPTPENQTGPLTLEIWVPPQFDPAAENPAAALLTARLAEFGQRHPGVRVTVRVKALEGPGGLMESLNAAAEAAPLALPDLIALPPEDLQTAADQDLIHPLDAWLVEPSDADWYPFAAEFAVVDNRVYGLPFAADALVLGYWSTVMDTPPVSWAAALEMNGPLVFPAADPRALTTLALYLARGGQLSDDSGRVSLEQEQLRAVLEFYEQAARSGLMPVWLTQYDQPEQAWQILRDGRATMAVVWASTLLQNPDSRIVPAGLPTHNGQPFTLASGWAWALAGDDDDDLAISAELAQFLTVPEFVAEWTRAAGLLPARPSALAAEENPVLAVAAQSLPLAQLLPDPAILDKLGAPLANATLAVLKHELSADEAAAQAADAVGP